MLPSDLLPSNQIPPELEAVINPLQMFRIIETLLPFESCLYHQVLPLSFEGEYLNLGMVDPEDHSGLDYVKQLLGSISCTLVPVQIKASLHQNLLTAYLNYLEQKEQPSSSPTQRISVLSQGQSSGTSEPSVLACPRDDDEPHTQFPGPIATETEDHLSNPFLKSDRPLTQSVSERETFILDPNLNDHPDAPPLFPVTKPTKSNPAVSPPPPTRSVQRIPVPPSAKFPPPKPVPELKLTTNYLASPLEVIQKLPPPEILQELMGRVLVGGIGRLFLERQAQFGRILWSQSGVIQSALEHLPIATFDEVVQELKGLAELPRVPIHGSQQVELERNYKNNRVLLRIRFMSNRHGEEATLQVLRGAALKFYEKKQIDRLGQDAKSIAQQLQQKLEQFRANDAESRETVSQEDSGNQTLSELRQILNTLNETLKKLE